MTLWPRSLQARTALVLLLGLGVVQVAGLLIHALDRIELQRLGDARDLGGRIVAITANILAAPPEQWQATTEATQPGPDLDVRLQTEDPRLEMDGAARPLQMLLRPYLGLGVVPPRYRPRETVVRANSADRRLVVAYHTSDERWLVFHATLPPPRLWQSSTFLISFLVMTAAAVMLTLWATRRLTAPVRMLAEAAERLGRDVNAPPLPEEGPTEVVTAAVAFNTMAERIRRFVQDRTFLLTAISHDLRTPITRLKLRAEWMEDEEQRRKMLIDLDELEAMVAASLAFGRDSSSSEPLRPVDLAALLRTVVDEAADLSAEQANHLSYTGPDRLTVRLRPAAMKRALTNLVQNALAYGGSAHATLEQPRDGIVRLNVDDDGPGIAADQLERVFEPFYRLEASRNRETGGTGLGLPITRNIVRAMGGDIVLSNRATGGLRATVTVPA